MSRSRISTVSVLSILFALHSPLPSAFAQRGAGSGGGGNFTESDMKHFLNNLVPYLSSAEGIATFPEIAQYNLAHPTETIEQIAQELNPHLVQNKVYDAEGNERDCVSSVANNVRQFECNVNNFPALPDSSATDAVKSEYYGDMYRLVLHETLVQAGLEDQLQKEIPSTYPISSRLNVHLEMFPEWKPGKATPSISKTKLVCVVGGDGPATYQLSSSEGDELQIDHDLKTKNYHLRAFYTDGITVGDRNINHISGFALQGFNSQGKAVNIMLGTPMQQQAGFFKNLLDFSKDKTADVVTVGEYATTSLDGIQVACGLQTE